MALPDSDARTPRAQLAGVAGAVEPILPLPFPMERRTVERPRVSVVIPVFNEEAVLARTYREVASTLEAMDVSWRLLFVNDGSRDGTVAVLESLFQDDDRVGYLVLSRNFGHQAALTAGLDTADGDAVISMDADLQHPPTMLPTLLDAWRLGYDVVHTRKLATVGLPRWREVVTERAYQLISRVVRVRIIPQASDFRLLDRSVMKEMRALRETGRLYRGLTPWLGFRQCVVPYVAAQRAAGTSQYSVRQLVNLFTRALFDFSSVPLQIGLLLGGVAVVLSAIYAIYVLLRFFVGGDTPPGWASIVAVTLFLNSITLAFMGIIGVYVARIYDEVRARPTYVMSRARLHDEGAAREGAVSSLV